jgi:hypothetical protein
VADPKDVLARLAVKDPRPESKFADLAASPKDADKWIPGKKLYLSKHPPVPMSADLERVLALPERVPLELSSARGEAMAELMTARWSRGERACRCASLDPRIASGKRKCLRRLKPVQGWALYEMGIVGGLIGSIPVGSGKTAIGLLSPLALEPLGVQKCVLLVPPNLLEQLHLDYQLLAEHFRVPSLYIHGLEKRIEVAGAPKLHVIPYSRLSLPSSSAWIRELRPDAIIADECDKLRDPDGAGSSRVMRYFQEFGETRFCGWTGSLTDSSIGDYAHLAAIALRMQSPLPLDRAVTMSWARALDEGDNPGPPGELERFCAEDLDPDNPEDMREGYRRRLASTMGVVVSTEASVDVDLVIEERPAPAIPDVIRDALFKVRTCWVRPDTLVGSEYDEELTDAFAVAKVARELASGIFYRWRFDPIHGVPQKQADIDEWYQARRDYNRELRYFLADRKEWLDSPLLCEHAAQRYWGDRPKRDDRPEWASSGWPRWREIKDKVKPTVEPCRVSDYLAVDAARWACEHLGIVWYTMVEFGEWVSELSGLPLHGGGPDAGVRLIGGEKKGKRYKGEDGTRSIIASIKSHGRGRDGLQTLFSEQLVAQIPTSATMWEQLLGRLHRQGQDATEVRAWYYAHTDEIKGSFETALSRAGYVRGTLGSAQKLLVGRR